MSIKKKKPTKETIMQGWKIKYLSDAFTPRPPREYAVEGVFAFSTLNMVFGVEGSMKSLLLMDMSLCVSEGLPWLPTKDNSSFKFITNKCNVLYVDCDNGSLTDDERINAFAISHGLTADNKSSFKYISMPDNFDLSDKECINKLSIVVDTLGIKMLVLDNLGLINSKDENSPEMAQVMSNLRVFADKGLCVIVVHHQRKTNGGQPSRLGETLRGHSSIAASLDFSYFISRKDALGNEIVIIPTKCRFAPVDVFGAEFIYGWIDGTKELQSAIFINSEMTDEVSKAIGLMPTILAVTGEIPQTQLVKELSKSGISQRGAKDAINKAIDNDVIKSKKGAHNSTLLSYEDENLELAKIALSTSKKT